MRGERQEQASMDEWQALIRKGKVVQSVGGGATAVAAPPGPAPVSLAAYIDWAARQKAIWTDLGEVEIRHAVRHLVVNDDTINRIGPAFTSGKPVLIYGNAGNGKTVLAEALATCLPDTIFV